MEILKISPTGGNAMTIKSTAPEIKYFNPASLVYYNSRAEMAMDLDARLSWFHHEKPGWKITIDGTRIFGMEVYVNNEYEDPDNPNEVLTAREKEIQYVAVGFVSMLDDNGVRVTTVPINTDATDPNFMGKLYEQGAHFLLDMNGYNPYNISAEQWREHFENKNRERNRLNRLRQKAVPGGTDGQKSIQSENTAESAVDAAGSAFISNAPESLAPDSYIRETISSSAYETSSVMELFKETLDNPVEFSDRAKLKNHFDKFCIFKVGDTFENLQFEEQKTIVDDIESIIASKKQG